MKFKHVVLCSMIALACNQAYAKDCGTWHPGDDHSSADDCKGNPSPQPGNGKTGNSVTNSNSNRNTNNIGVVSSSIAASLSNSNSTAKSNASSNANSSSNATGGNASSSLNSSVTANGGNSNASNAGNNQTSNYTNINERSAPSISQGSFAIQGCSVAGNVGGSNVHGSVFLGIGFTPRECYNFELAQAYQAIGYNYQACVILNSTKTMRRLHKEMNVPLADCNVYKVHQVVVNVYTENQVKAIVRKALQK